MDDATKASQAAFVRSMTPPELRLLVGFMIMFMPAIEVAAMLAYVRTARVAVRDQVIRERWFAEQPLSPAESDLLRGLLERDRERERDLIEREVSLEPADPCRRGCPDPEGHQEGGHDV